MLSIYERPALVDYAQINNYWLNRPDFYLLKVVSAVSFSPMIDRNDLLNTHEGYPDSH